MTEKNTESQAPYRVHLYAVVRVAVDVPEATSQLDAIEKAQNAVNLQTDFHRGEYADEVVSVLVDEVGDEEYLRSTLYEPDKHTGEWAAAEPTSHSSEEENEEVEAPRC